MPASRLHTLLVLGRVSNLPTVGSNCLAAWLLAGGTDWLRFSLLLASGTCLYIGGMFFNDACDAEFDRGLRQERPIPARLISRHAVWIWGAVWLVTGTLLAIPLGIRPLGWTLVLVAAIAAYDIWHKKYTFALGLVAGCRFLLYVLAGVVAAGTVSPRSLVAGTGIGFFVLGISLMARHEAGDSRPPRWPLLLLAMPVVTAWLQAPAGTLKIEIGSTILFAVWVAIAVFPMWKFKPQTGLGIGRLLAGLVLADWLQVAALSQSYRYGLAFASFFGITILLQRRVPAT